MLKSARKRIATHYGKPTAEPLIVVLSNKKEKERFGLYNAPGKVFFAPWNNYLLLNYQTANIDVTAHELVHAEVITRIGYLKRQFNMPTWFDEGAAMQVDYRPKYNLDEPINLPEFKRVTGLTTPSKFWTKDKLQNIDNYRSAKAAVYKLLKENETTSLYSLLSKIKAGEDSAIAALVNKTKKAMH